MSPSLPLQAIRIILVEPAGALNVGSVARVMKNMGLQQLVLVNPHCDHVGAEARLMAVHAPEILATARVVETLPQALAGCQRAIATTGRPHSPRFTLEHPRQAFPWLLEQPMTDSAALIFGPEDRGLNTDELHYAQRWVYIPTHPAYPSLNLAQAVAICSYELYQLANSAPVSASAGPDPGDRPSVSPTLSPPPKPQPNPQLAPLEQLDGFYQQLETLLLEVGYLYPHTANSRMQKLRRLFHRAMPTADETAMLRGVLSQIKWAMQQQNKKA